MPACSGESGEFFFFFSFFFFFVFFSFFAVSFSSLSDASLSTSFFVLLDPSSSLLFRQKREKKKHAQGRQDPAASDLRVQLRPPPAGAAARLRLPGPSAPDPGFFVLSRAAPPFGGDDQKGGSSFLLLARREREHGRGLRGCRGRRLRRRVCLGPAARPVVAVAAAAFIDPSSSLSLFFFSPGMGVSGAAAATFVAEWGAAAAYAAAAWDQRDRLGLSPLPKFSAATAAADFGPFLRAGGAVLARTSLLLGTKTLAASAAARAGVVPRRRTRC